MWGHEHECLIEPRYNPEMSFHVMQPGSSVATSLMPGEAVPKHVAIVSVTGKEFKCEPIRLKTVRPFVMREIALQDDSRMRAIAKKDENRPEITRYLVGIVEGLIEQAEKDWREAQVGEDVDEEAQPPKPLIRLRVEYTAPEGGKFDCENPQRFSNRFVGKVANLNDVVQFYRKKSSATRKTKDEPEMPEESILAQITIDTVKVEKLVREFLTAQSLTILPQNSFGDAVAQFVDKDDKHAMEMFVEESLKNQFEHLKTSDDVDEDDIAEAMEQYRVKLEELFAQGHLKRPKKGGKTKPRPDNWDSDLDGNWSDQPGARIHSDNDAMDVDEDADLGSIPPKPARGRGKAAGTTRKTAAATKRAAPARTTGRGKKKLVVEEEDEDEEEEEEPILIDDDEDDEEEEESQGLFVSQAKKAPAKTTTRRAASPKKKAQARSTTTRATRAPAGQQTTLNFSQSQPATQTRQTNGTRGRRAQEPVGLFRVLAL